MAFFNRLFNRKSKAELVTSSPQASLRRSLTDPQASGACAPARGRLSSSDDRDTFEMLPASRKAAARTRRAGCDLNRSKTSVEIGSVRSSSSSAVEPASSSADGSKSQYRPLRALHRSRLHIIMAAQDRSNKRSVVLKTCPKSRMSSSVRAKLEAEVAQLRALAGVAGVVQFLGHYEDEEQVVIVLERCSGPTLIELVANKGGRLSESALVPDVLAPLTAVLADLHRRGVVHRQIKPEHTLCCPEAAAVTLLDFSEAVNKNQRCLNNRAGALEYMAPEVLNKPTAEEVFHQVLYNGMSEEELPQYDEKADVWSLGVLAFEALTGCQPFLADTPSDMARLQRDLLTRKDAEGCPLLFAGRTHMLSREAQSFLLQALQIDPINRASAERLLQHPLIQRYWGRFQAKHAAAAGAATAVGRAAQPHAVLTPIPAPPSAAMAVAATAASALESGKGQAVPSVAAAAATAAAAAAAAAAATRTATAAASGGSGGMASGGSCAAPVAAHKAGLLVTAPLQFPVR